MPDSFQLKNMGEVFPIKPGFAESIFDWGKRIAQITDLSTESSLSYRHGLGFVVTRDGADLSKLTGEDLVLVEHCDWATHQLVYRGKYRPPAESFLHAVVYGDRSGAVFAFLAQAPENFQMEKSGMTQILHDSSQPMIALSRDVEKLLGAGNLFLIDDSSVLSFGCTAEDAGNPILEKLQVGRTAL